MYKLRHLFLSQQCSFMAMTSLRLMRLRTQRASFSSSAVKWEGGVSMVQGASRGIGLEFVSFCFFYSFALLHTYILLFWPTGCSVSC